MASNWIQGVIFLKFGKFLSRDLSTIISDAKLEVLLKIITAIANQQGGCLESDSKHPQDGEFY